MKLKIAIVSTYPPKKCGIGIYTRNMVNAMKNYEVEIITFKGIDYRDSRVKPILEKNKISSYLDAAIYLKKFDIVFIQHEYILYNYILFPFFLLFLKMMGKKTNIIMHTVAYYKGFAGFMFTLYHEVMLAFVDNLFLHTDIAQNKLNEKTLFKHKAIIIPHPIPKKYKTIKVPGAKKVYNLLCFGFLDHSKGFDIACKAVGGNPKYKLRIIGSINSLFYEKQSRYTLELMKFEEKYNNITVEVGFATEKEKSEAFNKADFIILPYREIEQSGVLCDAWGHGKIPICSDIPPFMSAISDMNFAMTKDEITWLGRLFSKEDPNSLKEELEYLTKDKSKQKRILDNIKELVNERSYKKLANQFIEEAL